MERKFVTNFNEAQNPYHMAGQVSTMIAEYNSTHPFEMLPKDTDVVVSQLRNGMSVMISTLEGNPSPKVIFHGSLYPNFESGEESLLGCQVVECGSWIVRPDYRGQGIGKAGVRKLLELGREKWNPVLFLATHKRIAALKVSQDSGLALVDYRDFPYLTYLTCTCTNCSESFGYEICTFRRRGMELEMAKGGKIDCSLVVSDIKLAEEFQERCSELHRKIGEPLESDQITVTSMSEARRFFEWIKTI